MKLQILYGGELSQSVSESLTELASEKGHDVTVFDMKDFKKVNLNDKPPCTVFIIQTVENEVYIYKYNYKYNYKYIYIYICIYMHMHI
jgi:hypothetical protein